MTEAPLRLTEVGRRLGLSTKEVLTLVYEHKIDYVMSRGLVHVPPEAVDRYLTAQQQ
ncbi:MAG: hypothetical protein ACR2MB_07145 [Acidimicrobiales bacterium]